MPSVSKSLLVVTSLLVACVQVAPARSTDDSATSPSDDDSGASSDASESPTSSDDESGASLDEAFFECSTQCLVYCAHEGTGAGENIIDDCILDCMNWVPEEHVACWTTLHVFGACVEFYSLHGCVERAPYIPNTPCAGEFESAVDDCLGGAD